MPVDGNDHSMNSATSAAQIGSNLLRYATIYHYHGVDIDCQAIADKFTWCAMSQTWLCQLTDALRSNLNNDQLLTYAPQDPHFMGSTNGQYPDDGYNNVHKICSNKIDWQGGITYNADSGFVQSSIQWSANSGVYWFMKDACPDNVHVSANKIVVDDMSCSTLKNIFDDNAFKCSQQLHIH